MIEILMTIKDRQDFLDRQLKYLRPYLSPSICLTIYDDGSDTELFLTGDTSFIRIFRSEINVGLIEARNRLLLYSYDNVKYVLFLDDDIFIYGFDKFIELALITLDSDSSLMAVSCPYINLPTKKYAEISTFKKFYDTDIYDSNYVVYFFGGTSLFNRKGLIDIGGFEGKYLIYLEEEDLALRAFLKFKKFKILYGHDFIAIHDQAPGKDYKQRNIFLLSNRLLFHYKFVGSYPILIFLNLMYMLFFLLKTKSIRSVYYSFIRYRQNRSTFTRQPVSAGLVFKFFKKRFF